MRRLFLDTEWADAAATELVSLALVSDDGAQRFYAEVDPLPAAPTPFVRRVVYPLLDRGDAALSPAALGLALRAFLASSDPVIAFDHRADLALLRIALWDGQALDVWPTLRFTLLESGDVAQAVEHYFATHLAAAARRHHAGVDAEALRWAVVEHLQQHAGTAHRP